MEIFLILLVIFLGVSVYDTRKRLSRLERGLREWRQAQNQHYRAPAEEGYAQAQPPYAASPTDRVTTPDTPRAYDPMAYDIPESPTPVTPPPPERPIAEAPPRVNFDNTAVSSSVAARASQSEAVRSSAPLHDDAATARGPEHAVNPAKTSGGTSWYKPSSFEDLFGRKLPIWAGGITLLVAAVLLVKWSIDAGMLSPSVRVILGLLFSSGLIVAAEIARRKADFIQDDRVAQALAGAGIGGLYAAILAAANLYDIIGPGLAFAGLTGVTALAAVLALRFGAPSAVLGLIGGLATPALVQAGEPNVPLLSGYLAIVLGGLTMLSRRQKWVWLGIASLVGGGVWTLFLIVSGLVGTWSLLAIGLLVLFLGIALPFAFAADRNTAVLRGAGAVIAALQLALLVGLGGFSPLTWGLYGLLSVAFIWLSTRVAALRPALFIPLIVGVVLIGIWPNPPLAQLVWVLLGGTLLYGGAALWRVWRSDGSVVDAGQIALAALGGDIVFNLHGIHGDSIARHTIEYTALAFAVLPFAGVALGLRNPARAADARFSLLAMIGGLLVIIASVVGLASWSYPIAIAGVAVALLALGAINGVPRLTQSAVLYLGLAIVTMCMSAEGFDEILRFGAAHPLKDVLQSTLRWASLALSAGLFAHFMHGRREAKALLQGLATVLAYGAIAQCAPTSWLPVIAAIGGVILAEVMARRETMHLVAAVIVAGGIVAAWMIEPLAVWIEAVAVSLVGVPVLVTSVPAIGHSLLQLLVPALLVGIGVWRLTPRIPDKIAPPVFIAAGAVVLVAFHILYKQLFHIATQDAFVTFGLAERTIWQGVLVVGGIALWRLSRYHRAAAAALCVGLLHNLVYSWGIHNPMWSDQAVGPWPIVNWLLPAAAISVLVSTLLPRVIPGWAVYLSRPMRIVQMVVVALFAYTTLRQAFAGSVAASTPIGAGESIGWSIVTIALAVGYLLWGILRQQRDWRIASLLLMLVAVGKVFLVDASGLEGLARIVSFLALGFSLIGIGWLYSRFLRSDAGHAQTAPADAAPST